MERLSYPLQYHRLTTRTVHIGKLVIGSQHPILIQSMLSSASTDTKACLQEIKALLSVGCQLIRLTIPSRKDLDAIPELRRLLQEEGLDATLVADIHFSPELAVDACELFEKVRINPGNYSDTPKNAQRSLNPVLYDEGKERLKEAIQPLIKAVKQHQRAIRIGVNQGSLSSRMVEQYGDSPLGMVQSALEMVQLFESEGVDQLVISLKSSNPIVVQKAYRLLVEMQESKEGIPLHLGVTEAGSGLMGRIKSMAGIAPLLVDGIGDTIRVSLTEPCIHEIYYAKELLSSLQSLWNQWERPSSRAWVRPLNHKKAENSEVEWGNILFGGEQPLRIGILSGTTLADTGIPLEPDFEYKAVEDDEIEFDLGCRLPLVKTLSDLPGKTATGWPHGVVVKGPELLFPMRQYYSALVADQPVPPIGLLYPPTYHTPPYSSEIELASVLSEGLLDFLLIPAGLNAQELTRLFYILQATRSKTLVTDYIACPSCGRTLFDLEGATERIKAATAHLRGLKIGIMGCIVNGPGEMADADFGYVGSGKGKIDLYYGQERVRRGIDEADAVSALIELIKEKDRWIDPPEDQS